MRLVHIRNSAIAGLLGAALLLGSPGSTDAEPGKGRGNGKGWRSERGEKRVERKAERRSRGNGRVSRKVERQSQERRTVRRSAPRKEERVVRRSTSRRSEERVVRRTERPSSRRSADRVVKRTTRRSEGFRAGRVVRDRDRVVRDSRVREGRSYRDRGRVTRSRDYSYRAPSRTRIHTSYRAPRWHGGRYYTGARYHTVYRGYPVYREYVSYRYRPAYAPVYGWRYYCAPRYHYPTRVIYVQPVRFFIAADFVIGGVGVSARYVDPGPVYGCNFCDARFGSYYDYEAHVEHHCDHIPHGYRVHAEDWHEDVWEQEQDDGYYEEWE